MGCLRRKRGAWVYPCFCLCLVLVQMTRTIPFRRTILQFSQILRTLVRTFMTLTTLSSERYVWGIEHYRRNSCNSQAHIVHGALPSVKISTPFSVIATVCSK